jgi:hypothetical protein
MTGKGPGAFAVQRAMVALQQARERLLAIDPDIGEDQTLLADCLEGEAEGDPFAVIDRLVAAAIHANDMAEIAHVRATELAERKARFKRRNEQLRGVVQDMLEALSLKRLERPGFTASIRAGTPRVVITDEAAVHMAGFIRTTVETDRAAISAALKAGVEVAGATLSNAPDTLALRTR